MPALSRDRTELVIRQGRIPLSQEGFADRCSGSFRQSSLRSAGEHRGGSVDDPLEAQKSGRVADWSDGVADATPDSATPFFPLTRCRWGAVLSPTRNARAREM
jgi:hypothetical protein